MSIKNVSLRKRLLLVILLFITCSITFSVSTEKSTRNVVNESHELNHQLRDLGIAISGISDTLHLLGIAMYQATFYEDTSDQPRSIQSHLEQLADQVNSLIKLPSVQANPEYYGPAIKLSENLQFLTIHAQSMLEIQADPARKYPAMPLLTNKLSPINREVMGLLGVSISEASAVNSENLESNEANILFRELRYVWSQLVSSVRIFVANRLGAFGPPKETMTNIHMDHQLYSEVVDELISQLSILDKKGLLTFSQSDSIKRVKNLHIQYEYYFKQASEIYYSDQWRADKVLLQQHVDPSLDVAWTQVYLIQSRINAHTQFAIKRFVGTADKISLYIWMAAFFTILLLVMGYLSFEFLIRKPIQVVTEALKAEGKGEHIFPALSHSVTETRVLVDAFSHMQKQIHSRQSRLQTILDNAGEGILTVNVDGKIESFNLAAQVLFRYSEPEVIGKDITLLIPAYVGIANQTQFANFVKQFDHNVLHGEHDVLGRCKDGRMFPMSLRLGKVNIDGEQLFTALVSDISDRKEMIDRLTQLAERDSLTGLYNRHFLMDELERSIDRVSRGESLTLALLYIDLDNFKFVNDTLGHLAGDNVLKDVTSILENRARGTDLITRLGGDEFAILIYDVDELQAKLTAEAYRKQLAEYIFHYKGQVVDVGCSIGVALLGKQIRKKEDLLSKADLACHIAKRAGRNNVHVYESQDQQKIDSMSADMGWSRRIKNAIENDEFLLVSQPIVDARTGSVMTNEILLRMKDTDEDVIMPSGFLPSADRFGLGIAVDRWVINHSFKKLAEQKDPFFAGYSINLTAVAISDIATLRFIRKEMSKYNIDPSKIIFEVTESSAIDNLQAASGFIKHLKKLGFKTALDDFGVGYSSFTYLKDLPVDLVKIDGSFVRNLCHDKVKRAIVIAMNDVAHALGKKTVAEFVEDKETLIELQKIGVDYSQGYFTGRPGEVLEEFSNVVYLHS